MAKFNVGDRVVVTSKYSIFSGQSGEIQSVFSSDASPGLVGYSVLIGKGPRFFHEDDLAKSFTLQEKAKQELDRIKDNPILNFEEKLNLAGWFNGEWTCACCGAMIGKNLKGESPFALARIHTHECSGK